MDAKLFLLITLAITGYIILGALLFQFIERKQSEPPDIVVTQNIGSEICLDKESVDELLRKLLDQVVEADGWKLNITVRELNESHSVNSSGNTNGSSKSNLVLHATFTHHFHEIWDLYGSIIFAETLVTTIGYGQIAPATVTGRMVSCLYSIIGIPMVGLWMTGIGENIIKLATMLRNRVAVKKRWHRQFLIAEAVVIGFVGAAIFIFCPAVLFSIMEGWTYTDGIYFSVITLATIGLGDYVAGAKDDAPGWYRVVINFWLLLGLGWLSMIISLSIRIFKTKAKAVVKQAGERVSQIKQKLSQSNRKVTLVRRNSFSGKRQVSVMLSRSPSVMQAIELPTGTVFKLREDASSTEDVNKAASSPQNPFVRRPGLTSRQNSLQPPVTIQDPPLHQLQLPTISESVSQLNTPSKRHQRVPSWLIGGELVVQTSSRRPSLGATANIVLFDSRQVSHQANNSTEQLEPSSQTTDNGIVINIVDENDQKVGAISAGVSSASLSSSAQVTPSASKRPSLTLASSTQPRMSVALRGHSLVEGNSTAVLARNSDNTFQNVIVLTDNGIAESLDKLVTVLRPRSRSVDTLVTANSDDKK